MDTGSGAKIEHRGSERFPMCSTFKLVAAAAVLKRVEEGKERLDRRIVFQASDIVVNSLFTKERVGGDGMTLAEICEAAMIVSDNTAGNLILATLGGPAGFTAYVRSLGDSVTRLDRIEPELNEALPGDPRDTTTPLAMLDNVRKLLLGDTLSAASREQLTKWMLGNKTGDTRLQAQLPAGLAHRRQNRRGRARHEQRCRRALAAGRQADRGFGLSHRNVGAGRQAECHAGCCRPRRRGGRFKTRRDVLAILRPDAGNLPYPPRHVPCKLGRDSGERRGQSRCGFW